MSITILGILCSYAQSSQPDTSLERLNTDGEKSIFLTPEELTWVNAFEGFSINFSMVSGNTFSSPHATFARFPSGFFTPPHTHGHSYKAVLISGKIINPMEGQKHEEAKIMGPGFYWYVPSNQIHVTACVSKEPCVFCMHQPVPFNFVPKVSKSNSSKN